MTFAVDEPRDFHRFLDKFGILDLIKWNEDLIDSSIAAVCSELNKEQLSFCWMDFSINKYMEHMDWHKTEAIRFIYESFERHYHGEIGLVLSIKYESTKASQRQYIKLIEDPETFEYLFGLDLVGDEAMIDYRFHNGVLRDWLLAGKMVRAHVGEFGSKENIGAVIQSVTNIAHGLKIIEDQSLVDYAIQSGITFDLGLTSNFITGIVTKPHPIIRMLSMGLKLTIGSDDPIICNTSLSNEYRLARELGVTERQLYDMAKNAIEQTEKFIKHKINLWGMNDGASGSLTNY